MSYENKDNILDQYPLGTKLTLTGIPVYQIVYLDTGFGVYLCEDENEDIFFIKGSFISPLALNQTYKVEGVITEYLGEKQLSLKSLPINIKPITSRGIYLYLQTLNGLKKNRADLIYQVFGDDSIEILMNEPEKAIKLVKGIGKKLVESWKDQLEQMKESQQTLATLLDYGLNIKQAQSLYKKYGERVLPIIEQNPYMLSKEVKDYGFLKCDKIARNMGYDPKSEFRIQEAIIYVLENASFEGHCFLPKEEFLKRMYWLLNIGLSIIEIKQCIKEFAGSPKFNYKIGSYECEVNYSDLVDIISLYENEKSKRKRQEMKLDLIKITEEEIMDQVRVLTFDGALTIDNDKIYLTEIYESEKDVAAGIVRLIKELPFDKTIDLEWELKSYAAGHNIVLEDKQEEAVLEFAKNRGGFHVLNGSAGRGKTFVLKIILEMLKKQYLINSKNPEIMIFAPTGKASKVASRATNMECKTIHRGLGYDPIIEGFTFNGDNPIDADCIIIDESSMLDIVLAKHFFRAVKSGTKVIFVGDTKQLPSVGPGNVLKDIIESGIVKAITLDVNKRQKSISGVSENADRVIDGQSLKTCEETKDVYVILKDDPRYVVDTIVKSVSRILANNSKFTLEDIQILCPQKNTIIGKNYLNYALQQEFNPEDPTKAGLKVLKDTFQIKLSENESPKTINLFFREKDKVIHIKNNYKMQWYEKTHINTFMAIENLVGITNGETGVIEKIEKVRMEGKEVYRIIVKYEDKYVIYDDDFDNIEHAYALTVHKSQGSQWPAVIVPVMMVNYNMLYNNLLYTAISRASDFLAVIGEKKAMDYAIKTHKIQNRYTNLIERLSEEYKKVSKKKCA